MKRFTSTQILVLGGIAFLFLYQYMPGVFRDPESFLLRVAAIIIAITVHEFNHALFAYMLGDLTPKLMGRLTLNPLSHLDPVGTVLLFIAQFGWGKPVLFNPANLKINPALGSALVSFAGPLANVILAALVFQLGQLAGDLGRLQNELLRDLVAINVLLAAFNLIPIPPLDGFGVLQGILPRSMARAIEPLRAYGVVILLALVFLPNFRGPDVLGSIMQPIARAIFVLIRGG